MRGPYSCVFFPLRGDERYVVRDGRSGRIIGPIPHSEAALLADELNRDPAPMLAKGEPLRKVAR